jgi:hypothetical protein
VVATCLSLRFRNDVMSLLSIVCNVHLVFKSCLGADMHHWEFKIDHEYAIQFRSTWSHGRCRLILSKLSVHTQRMTWLVLYIYLFSELNSIAFLFYHVTLCLNVILILQNYRYYTGYPKDLGPSRIIPFTPERQFVQLLHEGRPVVVAFTIKYINSPIIFFQKH